MNINEITKNDINDILDALNIIKTVCYNNICDMCPFSEHGRCNIKYRAPEDWELEEYSIWRAFKR